MDDVEQRGGIFRFVGLQLSDEMQAHTGMFLAQGGPFFLSFLDPVLAEMALAFDQQRFDRFGRMPLAHCHQRHVAGIAPGPLATGLNGVEDRLERSVCFFHGIAL